MKNKKRILWVGAISVVLLIIGIYSLNDDYLWQQQKETRNTELRVGAGGTESSLTYDKAIIVFAKERIEFNEECDMTPGQISIKNGMTMMFDNRFREARTFKLDGIEYKIPGYGFKLLQLKSTKLPYVVEVECGAGQGSGRINIQ